MPRRPLRIALTGFSGTGKRVVALIVADRLGWQVLETDGTRVLREIVFDVTLPVDASGGDAEFAVLAISTVPASDPSGAPVMPIALDPSQLNADILASSPDDNAGRGFRDYVTQESLVLEALQVLSATPLELGRSVSVAAHYDRALLASEVVAVFRGGR